MMTLKYSFQEPVGEIRINEDWSGEGNAIAGLQWPGGVVLRCVCVRVCDRERERKRETEAETERQERQTDRQRDKRDRERETGAA